LDEALFQARSRFPGLKIGRGQLVSMEKGVSRDRLHLDVAVVLAALYDLKLSELDEAVAAEVEAFSEVVTLVSPWNPDDRPIDPRPRLLAA
jgi:hypothetical protein